MYGVTTQQVKLGEMHALACADPGSELLVVGPAQLLDPQGLSLSPALKGWLSDTSSG